MAQLIDVPEIGAVEFPDGMPEDAIAKSITLYLGDEKPELLANEGLRNAYWDLRRGPSMEAVRPDSGEVKRAEARAPDASKFEVFPMPAFGANALGRQKSDAELTAEWEAGRKELLNATGFDLPHGDEEPGVTTPALRSPKLTTAGVQAFAPWLPKPAAATIAGVERGGSGFVDFFTSPLGWATLGIGGLPAGAQRAIALGFGVDMARHAPEEFKRLGEALGEGDYEKAAEAATGGALQVYFGAHALEHGIRGPKGLTAEEKAAVIGRALFQQVKEGRPEFSTSVEANSLTAEAPGGAAPEGMFKMRPGALEGAEAVTVPPEVPETGLVSSAPEVKLPEAAAMPAEAGPVAAGTEATAQVGGKAVARVPTDEIAVKPDLMQFKKMDQTETGLNEKDKLTGQFDELKAGNLLLWEPVNPAEYGLTGDQKYIVANGHHRFQFGRDQGIEGFHAQIVREADGISAGEARALGAEINIADGKGTIYDQARFIRNEAAVHGADAAMARARQIGAKGRRAAAIAIEGSDSLYESFYNERISPEQAEIIARAAPGNEALQRAGLAAAIRGKEGAELFNLIQALKTGAIPKATQIDLFGADDSVLREAEEMARRAGAEQRKLTDQIAAVQGAAKRPEQAAALGVNVSDPAGLVEKIAELKAARERWENWALHPDLVERVKAPKGTPAEAPKLRPMENQGDLLSGQKEDFALAPESGVDYGRMAEEKAAREAARRESEKNQGDLLGGTGALATIEQATLPRRVESETAGPEGDVVSLAEIRRYLSEALDIPVRLGRFGQRALGIFKQKAETIRVKALNDIPTIAHEVGHYLHFLLFPKGGTLLKGKIPTRAIKGSDFGTAFDSELMALGARTSRPSYTPGQVRLEGVAEFFREWLTDPVKALAKAPGFSKFFEGELQAKYPEVWKIVKRAQSEVQRYINQPAMTKLESRIALGPEAKERTTLRDFWEKTRSDWVNELRPMERALEQATAFGLPRDQAQHVSDLATNYIGGWRGKVEYGLHQRQIDLEGKDVGPSLHEVLGGIDDLVEFRKYLVGRRELELQSRGIETGLDPADAAAQRAELAKLDPKYKAKADALAKYMENDLRLLVDSGIISQEQFDAMRKANQNYVPFYRVMENLKNAQGGVKKSEGFINLGQGVYKIKGSDRQYVDPLESVLKNSYLFRDMAERNRVARSFVEAMDSIRGGGRIAEQIARKVTPTQVSGEEVKAQLEKIGIDVPKGTATADLAFKIWRAGRQMKPGEGIFTTWKDGKETVWQLGDADLYRSLALADSNDASLYAKFPGLKMMRAFTRTLRAGATLTAEFMARNPFRDQVTAGVFSKHGFVPFFDGFRGALSALKRDDLYWDWVKSGGRYADFVAMDRTDLQSALADVVKDPTMLGKALSWAAHPKQTLQKISELFEQATRVGEFRRAKEAGLSDIEAANASKDVTLNFGRAGFKGKLVNQLMAFFNAGIQDLSKFARAHQERPAQTMLKAGMYITAPSLLAWYLGKDDKAIQNLPEWRKNFFWNVNLGAMAERAGLGKGDLVFSLPKPFLLGQIYGSSVERGLDYATGRDPNAVKKLGAAILKSTPFTIDALIPTAARPVLENYANKSFFRNAPIEGQAMQALPPQMRATPQTSLVARELGRLTAWAGMGQSPLKIDNLIRGWLGGLGKYGTDATDFALAKIEGRDLPVEPAKGIWERPLLKAFKASPYEASVWVDRFYNGVQAAEERMAGFRHLGFEKKPKDGHRHELDVEAARSFWPENGKDFAFYAIAPEGKPMITRLREAREKLAEVNRAMTEVQTSRTLSAETKRERLITLSRMRDGLAEAGFKMFLSPGDQRRNF